MRLSGSTPPMRTPSKGLESPAEEMAEAKSKGMKREVKKVGSRVGKPRINRGGFRGGSYR